jgi:hypothetical protein
MRLTGTDRAECYTWKTSRLDNVPAMLRVSIGAEILPARIGLRVCISSAALVYQALNVPIASA